MRINHGNRKGDYMPQVVNKYGGNVVVIGGGASGMAAAIRAKQQGAESVILIEAADKLGGNAVFAPVPLLDRTQLTPEKIHDEYAAMMKRSNYTADPRMVSAFLEKTAELPDWFEGLGAAFQGGEQNGELAEFLAQKCKELGVDIRLNCYAKKIIRDADDWASGVFVHQNGEAYTINATVVVLATGGFLGENDLMKKYCPYYDEVFFDEVAHGGNLYSGNGVQMALDLGAGDEGFVSFEWIDNKVPFYKGKLTPCLKAVLNDPTALVVNNVGIRFADEANYDSPNAYFRQPNKDIFRIYDEGTVEALAEKYPGIVTVEQFKEDIKPLIAADQCLVADAKEPIAAWIRGKAHILEGALSKYAIFAEEGNDQAFGKDPATMLPFGKKGPYYVFRSGLCLIQTHGPIKVNPMTSCVNRFDFPVSALCACGAVIAGLYTDTFIGSRHTQSIRLAIATGMLAGEHAELFTRGGGPQPKFAWPKFTAEQVMEGDYYNVGGPVGPPGGGGAVPGPGFGAKSREELLKDKSH